MLFDSTKTPLISSKTKRDDLKNTTYKSLGKTNLVSEVTLELPSYYYDSFTQISDMTKKNLEEIEQYSCEYDMRRPPLNFSSPFKVYFHYLTHPEGDFYRPRNSPLEWFLPGTYLSLPHRFIRYPFNKEFSVEYIPKRDVETIKEEENDDKITIRLVWEDNEYIELRVFKIIMLQSILNLVLREPTWTRRYQIFVDDHKFGLFDEIWHSLGTLESRGLIYNHCIIHIRLAPKSVRYTTWLYFLSHCRFCDDK